MIIGVDADGVLTDMQTFNFQCGKEFFKQEIINPSGYSIKDIFGKGFVDEVFYGLKYFPQYCKEYPPRENAVQTLQKLREEGNLLYEITARKFVTWGFGVGAKSRKWFLDWCKKFGFSFEEIIFCSEKHGKEEKYKACKQFKVDIMIDDRPEIVLYLAERGIPILMFDAPYNQNVAGINITRVYSWTDVYQTIHRITTKDNH